MPLDAALVAETRSWLLKEEKDLRAAQHGLGVAPTLRRSCISLPPAEAARQLGMCTSAIWDAIRRAKESQLNEVKDVP